MPMEMEARQNEIEQDKWNYREKFHQQHANTINNGKI